MRRLTLKKITGLLLFSVLLVGCLRLPCYSASLSGAGEHVCCGLSQSQDTSMAPCCDEFIVPNLVTSLASQFLFVVEGVELPSLELSTSEHHRLRPDERTVWPPENAVARPSRPRAPPLL